MPASLLFLSSRPARVLPALSPSLPAPWLPFLAAPPGCSSWLLFLAALPGCPSWLPFLAALPGCASWLSSVPALPERRSVGGRAREDGGRSAAGHSRERRRGNDGERGEKTGPARTATYRPSFSNYLASNHPRSSSTLPGRGAPGVASGLPRTSSEAFPSLTAPRTTKSI